MRLREFPEIWAEHKQLLEEAVKLTRQAQELETALSEADANRTPPIEEEMEDTTLSQVQVS